MITRGRSVALALGLGTGALWMAASTAAAKDDDVRSPYLQVPSRNLERLAQLADFFERAKDGENGGFYTFVDRTGAPAYPSYWYWNTTQCDHTFDYHLKSVAAHSRLAYLYTRAFMVTGREAYLESARHALDFLYEHGWDEAHGGWWFSLDEQGEPAPWFICNYFEPNNSKWTYAQMYPLVGVAAYVEATRSAFDLGWLMQGLDLLDDKLWDARPGIEGYYTDADLDWSNPRGKGFTPSVDGITTHALAAHLLLDDPAVTARLLALADAIVEHLIPSIDLPPVQVGFAEQFDASWGLDPGNTVGNFGHMLKSAWVLDRAFLVSAKPAYREGAQRLIAEVGASGGYDFVRGAPFRNYDWSTGVFDRSKGYWETEQAVMAGLVHHAVSPRREERKAALEMADQSLQFFHDHFWDTEYGGHYFVTDEEGNVTDTTKSDVFEQGYHVSELLYYAYVYGNLLLHDKPIELYYRFEPSDQARTIALSPIALTGRSLRIQHVRRDGRPYHLVDERARTLRLPAGVGGTFRVTFKLD